MSVLWKYNCSTIFSVESGLRVLRLFGSLFVLSCLGACAALTPAALTPEGNPLIAFDREFSSTLKPSFSRIRKLDLKMTKAEDLATLLEGKSLVLLQSGLVGPNVELQAIFDSPRTATVPFSRPATVRYDVKRNIVCVNISCYDFYRDEEGNLHAYPYFGHRSLSLSVFIEGEKKPLYEALLRARHEMRARYPKI